MKKESEKKKEVTEEMLEDARDMIAIVRDMKEKGCKYENIIKATRLMKKGWK